MDNLTFDECLTKLMQLGAMFGASKMGRKVNQLTNVGDDEQDTKPTKPKVNGGKGEAADLANRVQQGDILLKDEWDSLSWP